MSLIVKNTTTSNGFTISEDAQAWCVIRGLSPGAIRQLGEQPPTHPLAAKLDLSKLGDHESLVSFVAALLDHPRDKLSRPVCTLLGLFMDDGALLAPLGGAGRSMPTLMFNPGLVSYVTEVLQRSGLPNASSRSRRVIANMWLCTVEGRSRPMGREDLCNFVLLHLPNRKNNKWISGLPDSIHTGLRDLSVSLNIKAATTKWARLEGLADEFNATAEGKEWLQLWRSWLDEKQPGSMGRFDRVYRLFCIYLSENPAVASVERMFSRTVSRPGLYEFVMSYFTNDSSPSDFLRRMYEFFTWILANDDRFSALDDVSSERIVRQEYFLPLKRQQIYELDKNRRSRPAETVQMALPMEYLGEIDVILTEKDMAWPKTRKSDWILRTNSREITSAAVYCPVLPNLVRLLLKLPLRQVQARRLDSGEGDTLKFDLSLHEWSKNSGAHAGYWEKCGARNAERGALRRIVDGWTGETLCGFYINSNKTADKKTNFDETSGYVIAWQNEEAIAIISDMRDWQERWNALEQPTKYTNVREGVFEKMHESAASRRPDCFFLFRYPGGYSGRFRESPPSGSQLRAFWYEILAELERRLRARNEDPPELISSWQGDVPTASPYTLHGLRHSGLTRLAQAGVHPWILKNIVAGHSDYVMTLYYIKPNPAHISAHLNERYMEAMQAKQGEFKQFLASRTLEEVHRLAVSRSPDAFVALDAMRRSVGNAAAAMSSTDHGLCPNGRTRCDEGVKLEDQLRVKRNSTDGLWGPVPQISGLPDCTQCRFFITGTPFIDGLRIKTNEISVEAASCAERYRAMSATISSMEGERIRALEKGTDWDHKQQQRLTILKQQIKSEAEAVTTYATSLHSHGELFQQVRGLLKIHQAASEPTVPALLFSEVPEFEWALMPRFEAVDELVQVAKWYPSIRSDSLRRERNEEVVRMLVRQGAPAIVVTLTDAEANSAVDALTSYLYMRLGRQRARKLFENQETLESLGLVADVETMLSTAVGQEVKLSLTHHPDYTVAPGNHVAKRLKQQRK